MKDLALDISSQIDWLAKALLGAQVLSPQLALACGAQGADYPVGRFRKTFLAITKILEKHPGAKINEIHLARIVGGPDALRFINSLSGCALHLDEISFCTQLTELRKLNVELLVLDKIKDRGLAAAITFDDVIQCVDKWKELDGLEHADRAFDPDKVLMTGTEMQALDIHVGWTVEKFIPERAVTLIYGPGGAGKTFLALAIAKAVDAGMHFLGLPTKQKPVFYIDRENPWLLLVERVRKMDVHSVRFWHFSFAVQPPKLDAPDWEIYKKLPTGGLIFFDTARSFHDGDENSSQDAGLVMNRLKELRERDNTIVLLHHTPRANERTSKGSTAWEDLADQTLAFHRVRRGSLKEIKEEIEAAEFDPDALYHLGTGRKTRYEPAKFYITANFDTGEFTLADDPAALIVNALAEYIAGEGNGQNQTEIYKWAKENIDGCGRKNKVIAALNRGAREGRWRVRPGLRGAKYYEPPT